jgi:hypothetical protein
VLFFFVMILFFPQIVVVLCSLCWPLWLLSGGGAFGFAAAAFAVYIVNT